MSWRKLFLSLALTLFLKCSEQNVILIRNNIDCEWKVSTVHVWNIEWKSKFSLLLPSQFLTDEFKILSNSKALFSHNSLFVKLIIPEHHLLKMTTTWNPDANVGQICKQVTGRIENIVKKFWPSFCHSRYIIVFRASWNITTITTFILGFYWLFTS